MSNIMKTVTELCARGHIYNNPRELVEKLAKACAMNFNQLEKHLMPVLDLAKKAAEGDNPRQRQKYKQWLKQCADHLYVLELASVSWITENVTAPKVRMPTAVQEVVEAGAVNKDVRLQDDPNLERVREMICGDVVVVEDIDEDALLASPVRAVSPPSPRRSPRIARSSPLMPPSEPKVSSPRARPPKTNSEPTRSQPVQNSKAKATVCASNKQVPDSKAKQSVVSVCTRPSVETSRKTTKQRPPFACKNTRLDSASSSSAISRRPLQSLTVDVSASSRTVTFDKPARGYSLKRVEGTLKRAASPPRIAKEDLKRAKTSDFFRNIRSKADQDKRRREYQSARRCWISTCEEPMIYAKVHAYNYHIPEVFEERLPSNHEQVLNLRRKALEQVARWLLGNSDLTALLSFITVQRMFSAVDSVVPSDNVVPSMQHFCEYLQQPIPDTFTLYPPNSLGVLLHYKAPWLLAASLSEEERSYWKENFHVPADIQVREVEVANPLVQAFDSHFHLDRSRQKFRLPQNSSVQQLLDAVEVPNQERVRLTGGVVVFCDPASYPGLRQLEDLPQGFGAAIGLHPRHSVYFLDHQMRILDQLRELQRHPRVVAVGEMGIDHTEPTERWAGQMEMVEKILPLVDDSSVLVLHCRGMMGDTGVEAYLLLLHLLVKRRVSPNQPIHLHCFSGDQYVVTKWLKSFPRTYFGFTRLAEKFTEDQSEALRSLDEGRLLLETDAPYFPPQGQRFSSPAQLYSVASVLARKLNKTPEDVLKLTQANARTLYSL